MAAPRSTGTATVSFGLVSIPVKLFTSAQTTEGISFRMLHGKCKTPLRQQYICPADGEKVERDAVVKGYEFAKDQYVLFTAEEIQALEEEATKTIAIEEFVPLSAVDPIYYDRAYYLAPDKGGERAYRLLSRALMETNLGGLARYAARGKQYLVLVRPIEGGLLMQQLRYAEEVRPFSEIPVGNGVEVKEVELNLALQLLQQSTSDAFRPEKYVDDTVARFREILQKKIEGEETVIARGEEPPAKVIDLMEALKASLAASGGGKTPASRTGGAVRGSSSKAVGAKAPDEAAGATPAEEAGRPNGAGTVSRRPARTAPPKAAGGAAASAKARRASN